MAVAAPGALADVTVLDLSDQATVFAGKLLADLGAEVIRVEPAEADSVRRRPPFLADEEGPERSLAHLLYNAGKRSVALDLGGDPAWNLVRTLAASAEVVIAPLEKDERCKAFFAWLRGQQESLGTNVVDLVFRRGAEDELATDIIATAAGGLLTLSGFSDDPPNQPAGELAYKQASLTAAEAALALTMERRRTGKAGWITVGLQEAVNFTTLQTANANIWHWRKMVPSRHTPVSAFTIFKSRDDEWTSFVIHPPHWSRFVEWAAKELGEHGLEGPEWEDMTFRNERRAVVATVIGKLCAKLDQAELIREGQALGLLVHPVNSPAQIAADPHLLEREFFAEVEHASLSTPIKMPRTPFLSTARPVNPQPAPTLGQHTEEVLREVTGLPSPEVDSLFETGIAAGARSEKPTYAGRPSAPPTKQAGRRLTPRQPLEGVRILDFCWAIAGPLSTRLLADLGADVIKVESEYRTDPIRYIGVQPESITSFHTNGQFNDCNTNKRAFTLNLNTPQGIELVRKLATTADVVISNYTPDRLDRWGLSYETLNELRPNVIVANLAVMGTHGPHKGWRSYGNGIVAMCGLGDRTGFPDKEPIGLGTLHTDFTVPYFAATHVLAALIERNRTGKGQYLELAQYEASVHLLDTELMEQLNNGCLPDRAGNRSVHLAPHGAFPAVGDDKWIAIACRDDEDWRQLSGIPGLEALATVTDRRANEAAVEATLSDWTKQRDAWEASRELQEAGIPASPVEDLHDLLHRDAAMQSDFRETAIDDGITAMVQEQPILWDGHRLPIERAPRWSEHTEEVLKELGVDDHRIADLAAANVLF